jgi:hypothetical protein
VRTSPSLSQSTTSHSTWSTSLPLRALEPSRCKT